MKNIRSNKAFTLVEVLIVLIIIGVLAGLVYLSAGGADDSAKRAACLSEREKIKSQYAMDQFGTTESFDVRIAALIKEDAPMANGNATSTEAKYTGLCASGGEYTIKPTDIGITVSCNHKGHGAIIADSGTTNPGESQGSGSYITGTYTPPNFNINTYEDFKANITGTVTITLGQTFLYNGKYYVLNSPYPITSNTPYDSISTYYEGIIEIKTPVDNSMVKTWGSIDNGAAIPKGTIVSVIKDGKETYFVAYSEMAKQETQWDSNGPLGGSGSWYAIGTSQK